MKRIGDTSWETIFSDWRAREASNPEWIKTATEAKGWPDWESWRMFTANQLGLPARTWVIYKLTDPMHEIPAMLVGPYPGWQSRLPRPNVHTFADLVAIPEQAAFFSKLQKLATSFPGHTQFIGLRRPDGRIVCLEGHHRATAVALAAKDGQRISVSSVQVAVADLSESETGLLDAVLARGSTKNPPKK